jgi:hypothetical protein
LLVGSQFILIAVLKVTSFNWELAGTAFVQPPGGQSSRKVKLCWGRIRANRGLQFSSSYKSQIRTVHMYKFPTSWTKLAGDPQNW